MVTQVPTPENSYPGETASPDLLRALAMEYREAALCLRERGRRGQALSWAPFRLAAIQAIELYLSAFLLDRGFSPTQIRSLHHDLGRRSKEAMTAGLCLRAKTAAHLAQLSQQREYLATRYASELMSSASQINRLIATLDEVAKKVTVAASRASVASAA